MSTIAVGSGNIIRPFRHVRIQHYPEDASQSFKKGEPVIFSSTGGKENKIKISGADPTALLIGIAAADASGVEGTMVPVWLFTSDAEFRIQMADTQSVNRADRQVSYGIVKDATNVIWRLDNTETTAKVFVVTEFIDAHGDVNGAVVVRPTTATHKVLFGVN